MYRSVFISLLVFLSTAAFGQAKPKTVKDSIIQSIASNMVPVEAGDTGTVASGDGH